MRGRLFFLMFHPIIFIKALLLQKKTQDFKFILRGFQFLENFNSRSTEGAGGKFTLLNDPKGVCACALKSSKSNKISEKNLSGFNKIMDCVEKVTAVV